MKKISILLITLILIFACMVFASDKRWHFICTESTSHDEHGFKTEDKANDASKEHNDNKHEGTTKTYVEECNSW